MIDYAVFERDGAAPFVADWLPNLMINSAVLEGDGDIAPFVADW